MRQVFLVLKNDIRRRLHSPVAVLLMMLIPVVLTLIIGLVFGRKGDLQIPRIKVLLVDMDNGIFSNFLRQGMQRDRYSEMIDIAVVEQQEGMSMMESGKASALIIIPEGFTVDILDHRPVELKIVKNPSEAFLPVIVEEMIRTTALVIEGAVRIFSGPIDRARLLLEGDRWPSGGEIQDLLDGARDGIALARGYVADSLIAFKTEDISTDGSESEGFNIYAFLLPGSLLIGLLFISELVLRDIVREKQSGTLARLFTTPVDAGHVVAGKILSTFAITGAACVILMIIGRFGFSISLGEPLPFIVHLIGTVLMSTGIMTLFYGFIRSDRAADAILPVVIIVLALMGGSMVPYEQMGDAMQRIARFSPVFWAVDGFKGVFIEDAGLSQIALHLVIIYSIAAVTVVSGAVMLRRRIGQGG